MKRYFPRDHVSEFAKSNKLVIFEINFHLLIIKRRVLSFFVWFLNRKGILI